MRGKWREQRRAALRVLLAFGLAACSDTGQGTGPDGEFARISPVVVQVLSGDHQDGQEGTLLQEPVVLRTTRQSGTPVGRVPLRLSVIHGGGTLHGEGAWVPQTTVTLLTDQEGLAQVRWRLGSSAEHIMKVSVANEPDGTGPSFTGSPVYVFGGIEAEVSMAWTKGFEFRIQDRVLSHDDRILETPHFLTFSDGSSDEAKVIFAAMAEESLQEILDTFGISDAGELGLVDTDPTTKLTIFSNHTMEQEQKALSFLFGFLAAGADTDVYASPAAMRHVVKHEMSHLFHMLFAIAGDGGMWPWLAPVWFSEGLAEQTAGGSRTPILTLEELSAWMAPPDHFNPVSIREWGDFPASVIERTNGFEYYPMFDLAVRYLLDGEGHGKSYTEVLAMCEEMRAGAVFEYAFQKHMGITVQEFETGFQDRVTAYLGSDHSSGR